MRYKDWAKQRPGYNCGILRMKFLRELFGGGRKIDDKFSSLGMRFADNFVPYANDMGIKPAGMYQIFDEAYDLIDNPYDNEYTDYMFDKKMWDYLDGQNKEDEEKKGEVKDGK